MFRCPFIARSPPVFGAGQTLKNHLKNQTLESNPKEPFNHPPGTDLEALGREVPVGPRALARQLHALRVPLVDDLGEAEVGELDAAGRVEEDVRGLGGGWVEEEASGSERRARMVWRRRRFRANE